jgi:hypothetical protein
MDLADAIALVRGQIAEAQARLAADGDKGVALSLGAVTLELGMELAHTRGAEGGLRFGVLSAGGKRERGRTATHTMTVTLEVKGASGRPVDVKDKD